MAAFPRMHWAGNGTELWRVRVDLFAPDNSVERRRLVMNSLRALLTEGRDPPSTGEAGVDGGLGVTSRPVTGLLFWVGADDVGAAARAAVETARRAGSGHAVGPELYDVTVIPRGAVVLPDDPAYPRQPD